MYFYAEEGGTPTPYMGAHWRLLANTIEPSVCGGDAVLCQITLTTCYPIIISNNYITNLTSAHLNIIIGPILL